MQLSTQTSSLRNLALASYLALLLWFIIWQFLVAANQSYSLLFRILWVVPLLLPLAGMLRSKPYTYAWTNFIILIYLIHGLTGFYALPTGQWLAGLEVFFSLLSLVFCSLYARKRGQELGMGLQKLSQVMEQERQHFEGK